MNDKIREEEKKYFALKFSELLKQWKVNTGFSQETLAAELGDKDKDKSLSPNTITAWKKGRILPSDRYLKKICEYFNVSEDYFTPYSKDHPYKTIHRDEESDTTFINLYSRKEKLQSNHYYTEEDAKLSDYCNNRGISIDFVKYVTSNRDLSKIFPLHLLMSDLPDKGLLQSTGSPFQVTDDHGNTVYLNAQDLEFMLQVQQMTNQIILMMFLQEADRLVKERVSLLASIVSKHTDLSPLEILKECSINDFSQTSTKDALSIINCALAKISKTKHKKYAIDERFKVTMEE